MALSMNQFRGGNEGNRCAGIKICRSLGSVASLFSIKPGRPRFRVTDPPPFYDRPANDRVTYALTSFHQHSPHPGDRIADSEIFPSPRSMHANFPFQQKQSPKYPSFLRVQFISNSRKYANTLLIVRQKRSVDGKKKLSASSTAPSESTNFEEFRKSEEERDRESGIRGMARSPGNLVRMKTKIGFSPGRSCRR